MRVRHKRPSNAMKDFVQVSENKYRNEAFVPTSSEIKCCLQKIYFRRRLLEQCCIQNGVPDNCIGLCIEEQDAVKDRFMSVCDAFETVIEGCTGENIVLQAADIPK